MYEEYQNIWQSLIAPGAEFEIAVKEIRGNPTRIYANAPGNMRDVFLSSAQFGDNDYLVYEDERLTYKEVHTRVKQIAAWLSEQGVQPGDHVAIAMRNYPEWLQAYWATLYIGATVVGMNAWWTGPEMMYALNDSMPKVLILDQERYNRLAGHEKEIEQIKLVGVRMTDMPAGVVPWDDLLKGSADVALVDLDPDSDACIVYTSGTTGHPKGVEYEHRSQYLHTMAQCMTDSMNLSATDAVLGIVPMFHAMGWGLPWSALMLGCKQVMPHRFMDPKRLLELIESEGVTVSAGVPTIWQGIKGLYQGSPGKYDLSNLSRLTCGGSAPPPSLIRWYWDELGVEMIQGWGMTETSPLATLSRRVMKRSQLSISEDQQFANVAKAGQLMPGIELEIFDEEFNPLPHDGETVGEILIRGPWICSEYYNNPQPEKFHDGWLITGDVGKIDPEEYLIISDRSKDLVKSGGEWISSVDLENHIVALDGIAQACVVAQPHPKWDERPVALVILEPGKEVSVETVLAHCATAFAKWQLPDDVLFVDSIPLTSTGKMDKKIVRADLDAQGYQLPDLRNESAG